MPPLLSAFGIFGSHGHDCSSAINTSRKRSAAGTTATDAGPMDARVTSTSTSRLHSLGTTQQILNESAERS